MNETIDWNHLKKLSKMETPEDIELFENEVGRIVQTSDPEALPHLLDLFDDDCEFPEVMFGLIHAIEVYPNKLYVQEVIKKIKDGVKKYPVWMDRLCNRIFNHPEYLAYFRQHMHLAPKESLLKLFEVMEEESPHHKALLEDLRKALG